MTSKKTANRISGPIKNTQEAVIDGYEVDPSLFEDALQNVSLAEGILYQNNARVQVGGRYPNPNLGLGLQLGFRV